MKVGQIDAALAQAEAAVKLDPEGFESNLLVGMLSLMEGDYPSAVAHLSKAHLLQPAKLSVANQLALALVELPDEASRTRALQFAQINARQQANNVELLATLGWINFRLGNKAEADQAFQAALRANAGTASRRQRRLHLLPGELGGRSGQEGSGRGDAPPGAGHGPAVPVSPAGPAVARHPQQTGR